MSVDLKAAFRERSRAVLESKSALARRYKIPFYGDKRVRDTLGAVIYAMAGRGVESVKSCGGAHHPSLRAKSCGSTHQPSLRDFCASKSRGNPLIKSVQRTTLIPNYRLPRYALTRSARNDGVGRILRESSGSPWNRHCEPLRQQRRGNPPVKSVQRVTLIPHYRLPRPCYARSRNDDASRFPHKKPTIMVYYPFKFEVNILPLVRHLRAQKFKIFLPSIQNLTLKMLPFALPFVRNKLGIFERAKSQKFLSKVDVIIAPVIGVDAELARVGFGSGMYDRFWADLMGQKADLTEQKAFFNAKNTTKNYKKFTKKGRFHLKNRPLIILVSRAANVSNSAFGQPHDMRGDLFITPCLAGRQHYGNRIIFDKPYNRRCGGIRTHGSGRLAY